MTNFYINSATNKFEYIDETGLVWTDVADSLLPVSINMYYDTKSDAQITFETISNGVARQFILDATVFSRPDYVIRALYQNGYFIQAGYSKVLRFFLMNEIQKLQTAGTINYFHKSLGFFTEDDGSKVFLLERNTLKHGTSSYDKPDFEFSSGSSSDYNEFLEEEILPYKETQFALVLGLSSVTASYLKDYADVNTLLVNLSGKSSTGKTTMSQFIASLWANPRISNSSLVKTFNSTEIAKLASIEGYNGVPIIFDDATTLGAGNKSKLIYQLAEGESRARSTNFGQSIAQGLRWSGLALITSETPILDDSDTRLGLRARVLNLSDIVWTQDGPHSKRIKNFISSTYGYHGQLFVDEFLKLDESEIKEYFDKALSEMDEAITVKDDISNRIMNKLAIVYSTSIMIKEVLKLDIDIDYIKNTLVELDQSDVKTRHPGLVALEQVKHYITKYHRRFEKYDEDDVKLLSTGQVLMGIMKFYEKEVEVQIPSKSIKEILRDAHIYDYNAILKYWGDNDIILKQGTRHTVNVNRLDSRSVRFVFERTDDTILPWDYPFHAHEDKDSRKKPPKAKSTVDTDLDIDEIFKDEV